MADCLIEDELDRYPATKTITLSWKCRPRNTGDRFFRTPPTLPALLPRFATLPELEFRKVRHRYRSPGGCRIASDFGSPPNQALDGFLNPAAFRHAEFVGTS